MKSYQSLFLLPACLTLASLPAIAQITPDGTLPDRSLAIPNGNTIRIDGGTAAGNNLFHSFEEFSLPTGREVFFNNRPEINNIFSRVTGSSVSNIDGILRANGRANLFLLNPNGIIFGPNARLNIGGSFLATTAESFVFADGIQFAATESQQTPILSINVPIGLQFGARPGIIAATGSGHNLTADPNRGFAIVRQPHPELRVGTGQTLALVGGQVNLNGANLTAESGRIELGSVGPNSSVGLSPTDSDLTLNYGGVNNFGDIELRSRSSVDASGEGGGDIQVRGRRISVTGDSVILALTEGSLPGGSLTVSASESLELIATGTDSLTPSSLITETKSLGSAGDLSVTTGRLTVLNGAQMSTSSFSRGSGGDLSVNARGDVEISGTTPEGRQSSLIAATIGFGPSGSLGINSDRLTIQQGALVSTTTLRGNQPGGDVTINTRDLRVLEGAQLSTGTFGAGDAGDLFVRATERAIVSAGGLLSEVESINPNNPATGRGGNITLETRQLFLQNGGQINAATFGLGNAGNIVIRASESVEAIGSGQRNPSGLFSQVDFIRTPEGEIVGPATGSGGNITVETRQLRVLDGAQISAATSGEGTGGTVTVNAAELVEVRGSAVLPLDANIRETLPPGTPPFRIAPSAITAITQGEKDAGNLTINSDRLIVADGGQITASTRGSGNGGILRIDAASLLEVRGLTPDNRPSRITARTEGSGNAGDLIISTRRFTVSEGGEANVSSSIPNPNIFMVTREELGDAGDLNINAPDVRLNTGGTLSAETAGGLRGNINIVSEDVRLRRGSRITTNAQTTTGGNIDIDTEILTALENSDIIANALEGRGGRVTIDARRIFGTEFREVTTSLEDPTPESDIAASSNLGPEFNGIVELNTPDIDPTQGLVEFDENIVDIDRLIDENLCEESEGSQFTITGRGGLPDNPWGILAPPSIWEPDPPQPPLTRGGQDDAGGQDVYPPQPPFERGGQDVEGGQRERIVEAQGLIVNAEGKIQLTTESGTATPWAPWYVPPGCQKLSREGEYSSFLVSSRSSLPLFAADGNPAPTVTVKKFQFVGNEEFSNNELNDALQKFIGREMTFAELVEARSAITQFYTEEKYITSGAYIPPQVVENNTVEIRVVEGVVRDADILVSTNGNLNENYLKSRLQLAVGEALNEDRLLEGLQLLRLNPLIDEVKAELSQGISPGTSILEVAIKEVNPWDFEIISDNGKSPGTGTFQRGAEISNSNFLGRGDRLTLAYNNSDGSNNVATSYTLPINPRNGTISISYENQSSEIIEPPFDPLDIEADSETYQLTFRQPIVLKPNTEFALGLTASRRESQTSILGENFPLSRGANSRGETKLSTISFFQDWVKREDRQIFAARSEFNLGLDAFDATVNNNGADSRFFSWQGQAQFVRRLDNNNTLLLMRGNVQLTPDELVGLEQFGLGGLQSVRGYRQDARLTDNGVLGTVELRLPISWVSNNNRRISLVPFVDGGVGWNNGDNDAPTPNALASVGLGLQAKFNKDLTMRFDYAIPLVEIDSRDRTWQENGLYFSLELNRF